MTASERNVGTLAYAFTEQGVAMLSSVLRSPRAVAEDEARKATPKRGIGFVA